jgi:hypothetical protein
VPRRQDIERRHVLAIEPRLLLCECGPVSAGSGGPFQQRVIDVGDVLDVIDLQPTVAPDAVEQIEGNVGVRVADVRRVVGRDAADIDACCSAGRTDIHQLSAGGVECLQRRRGR